MITQQEAERIVGIIVPVFADVANEYDFGKYPATPYANFQTTFAGFNPSVKDFESSLKWKWGHWGKQNFPQKQRLLIDEIRDSWEPFLISGKKTSPMGTFDWWTARLDRAYITVAYMTHLIHHRESLPIIDQHNFRAMNNLIRNVRPGFIFKKKPSNWQDLQNLKAFMEGISQIMPGITFSELDKFLMMYGRTHVPR